MYSHKVEICGINTAKLKNLTVTEQDSLMKQFKNGDTEAREKLIAGNLRLVLSVIQRFLPRDNPDDLFQVGCVGLMKAVDNFDVSLDVRFSTYAVPMIIGEIRRYLRDNNAIHVSRSVRDLAYRTLTAKEELSRLLDREPTLDELSKKVGAGKEEIEEAIDAIAMPVSFYEPVYTDGGDSVYVVEQISDHDNTDEHWLENIAIREAMKNLSPREAKIVDMRFYKGRTQTEIADEIGISQAQVSRIEKSAVDRIRKKLV